MSEENKVETEETQTITEETTETTQTDSANEDQTPDPIETAVNERLSKMKENMDRMVKERDEALKKAAEVEHTRKQEQIKRLEEEGKVTEALEMKLAEAQAQLSVLNEQNTSLARDNVVNSALGGLEFRNDRSREMARREIVEQLVQNEHGSWVHKGGTSINDFIKAFSANEENAFLFRVKANSGGGSTTSANTPDMSTQKSLKDMSSQELIEAAAKGKLKSFTY